MDDRYTKLSNTRAASPARTWRLFKSIYILVNRLYLKSVGTTVTIISIGIPFY